MIPASTEKNLNGFAQQLPELSKQLCAIFDVSMGLENCAYWYNDPDPTWGAPQSKERLLAFAASLRQTYMSFAALTGLDPCDQFEGSKQRISKARNARSSVMAQK
jgi:hypothetical protein